MLLENVVYSCLICLHLFDSELQAPDLTLQDKAYNECLNQLFEGHVVNLDLHDIEKTMKENPSSFDSHTLPLLRGVIEEKIEYAYNNTEAYDFGRQTLLTGLSLTDTIWNEIHNKFLNILREIYQYEKDIKKILEEQKESIMSKVDQKVNEIIFDYHRCVYPDQLQKNETMAIFARVKQQEVRRSAEMLVESEKKSLMKRYSKMVADFYIEFEQFIHDEHKNYWKCEKTEKAVEAFKEAIRDREMPGQRPGFEEILLNFNQALEEVSEELDRQTDPYVGESLLYEKFNISLKEYKDESSKKHQSLIQNLKALDVKDDSKFEGKLIFPRLLFLLFLISLIL